MLHPHVWNYTYSYAYVCASGTFTNSLHILENCVGDQKGTCILRDTVGIAMYILSYVYGHTDYTEPPWLASYIIVFCK